MFVSLISELFRHARSVPLRVTEVSFGKRCISLAVISGTFCFVVVTSSASSVDLARQLFSSKPDENAGSLCDFVDDRVPFSESLPVACLLQQIIVCSSVQTTTGMKFSRRLNVVNAGRSPWQG